MATRVQRHRRRRMLACVCVAVASAATPGAASALEIPTGSDWSVHWDNSASWGLGLRAQDVQSKYGNSPVFQNSEYKFDKAGSVVTNRFSLLSELDVVHGDDYGFRVSGSVWKDFAYTNKFETNPGNFGPGIPYAAVSANPSGRYSGYTSRLYRQGAELQDAFAFGNFTISDMPVSLKAGRFTEFWGNALYAGFQAISYSQSPMDLIKATTAPGSQTKELFMPRAQVSGRVNLSREFTIGGTYALEWRAARFPEGGTFLGIADPFFVGGETLGPARRGSDSEPADVHNNFGVQARWAPDALDGTLGFYYRRFDEAFPTTTALVGIDSSGSAFYHLPYAKGVNLYGVSLDKSIGPLSTGFEVSYRQGTGLFSTPGSVSLARGEQGAKGDTINMVANALYGLPRTSLFDTGTLIGEIAYTRLLKVTHSKSLYHGIGYACSPGGLAAGQDEDDGCATRDNVSASVSFTPQWLQALPGIDISMPTTVGFGIYGNGQYLGTQSTGSSAKTVSYTIGVSADIRQQYNVKLAYNGYWSATNGVATNLNGEKYYSTGRGNFMWNDRSWVSLVLKASF